MKKQFKIVILKHGSLLSSTKLLKPPIFHVHFNYWQFQLCFLPADLLAQFLMGIPNTEVNLHQSTGRRLSGLVNHEPSLRQSQPSALQAVTKDPDLLC